MHVVRPEPSLAPAEPRGMLLADSASFPQSALQVKETEAEVLRDLQEQQLQLQQRNMRERYDSPPTASLIVSFLRRATAVVGLTPAGGEAC